MKAMRTITTLTNSYEPKTTEINVEKVWDDDDDNDGKRPGSVTVIVLANGDETENTAILSDENGWTYIWNGLPVYADGAEIEYSIKELEIDGYESGIEMEGDAETGYSFTITNTHENEETEATVIKVWNDNDDAAGKRGDTVITVQLLANNEPQDDYKYELPYEGEDENVEYTEDGNKWTLTVRGLPKYVDGVLQTYSWIEKIGEGSDYAMTAIETTMTDGIAVTTITNTYDTDRFCLEVLKVWDDDNNSAGFRPDEIVVTLMKVVDGKPVAFAEGELPTQPFDWDQLATIAGATVAVLLIVQLLKLPIDKIWKIPTRIVAYVIALVVMLLATHFTIGLTWSNGLLAAFNAVIVTLAAMGSYELTFAKIEKNGK